MLESGAMGDGTIDDTKALQRAADEHLVLFVPYGTYMVSDTVTLRDGARVFGEGLSMIQLMKASPGMLVFFGILYVAFPQKDAL